MATLSQKHSQRVIVRRTDRTPPKVTNASMYQTHTGAMVGCAWSVLTGRRKHSVGRVTIDSITLLQQHLSLWSHICVCLPVFVSLLPCKHRFGEITRDFPHG